MTTENLKAVLTEEEWLTAGMVKGHSTPWLLKTKVVAQVLPIIERLADEVVRLKSGDYMEGFEEGVASCQDRIRELEAKLTAWEDAPRVEVSGQALVDYTGDEASDGTYHLKPKEAQGVEHNAMPGRG